MASQLKNCTDGARFQDRFGAAYQLIPGHRDELKPGWRRMLDDEFPSPPHCEIVAALEGVASRMNLASRMLAAFGAGFDGTDALIVGCGDVVEPMFVSSAGARFVLGIDRSVNGEAEQTTRCASDFLLRKGLPEAAARSVELREENIAASSLPDQSFDLVCSWRTLEHIADPRAAFAEMHRLLRPGGFAYHEYNPFCAIDGGHSLVTLDVPWGHVRFDREDIEAYLNQFRPQEATKALAYFDNSLNRMTMADLNKYATDAGFEILAVIPRTHTEDLIKVDAKLLTAVQRNYPTIMLNDLISRIVRVVLRSPIE
jgi:SAM-dependent methyltransferase